MRIEKIGQDSSRNQDTKNALSMMLLHTFPELSSKHYLDAWRVGKAYDESETIDRSRRQTTENS